MKNDSIGLQAFMVPNGHFAANCHGRATRDVPVSVGEIVTRDGFRFADLLAQVD